MGSHPFDIPCSAPNLVRPNQIPRCARNDKYLLEAPQNIREPALIEAIHRERTHNKWRYGAHFLVL